MFVGHCAVRPCPGGTRSNSPYVSRNADPGDNFLLSFASKLGGALPSSSIMHGRAAARIHLDFGIFK